MHIVIVNRWPRFSDGIRWDNELTRYEEFIDHEQHRVSYVVDPLGAAGVLAAPTTIARIEHVNDVNDFGELLGAVTSIIEHVGPVDHLIALSEFTLEIAARVRAELGIPGPGVAEVAVYRNKVRMKEILAAAGVRVPRFAPCEDVPRSLAFAQECGYPAILKTVDGAASIGVHQVPDAGVLEELLNSVDLTRHEIEEFVTGDIYHVDGFAGPDAEVQFQVVSRYINNCLAFEGGEPLGSVVVQRSPLRDRIEAFTRECLGALDMRTTPFHLELFVTPADDLVFLEIGGRVGGSEVPHLLNRMFGVNLFEVWLRAMTGTTLTLPGEHADRAGGWLVIPKPKQLPTRVVRVTSMRESVPSVWRELLPQPGEVLEPGGSYDAMHSGRFILLADDEATVEKSIVDIISRFKLEVSPL
ncbi:hypothetical protein NCC78_10670 [Micromonospora phytophila]|uniref:ATP-grasp domain-containing protein n=1 Tax=Micromonospora phytophila TaxID=709888 RepID=UPI00202F6244|nr:hypothetical protein [Micromonospora phytophila]MCM0675149.1 hypothetical protein [Micromonospora phytophila]